MIIDKKLIVEAKEKFGIEGARIIANDLKLERFDEENLKACCHWHREDTPSLSWDRGGNYFHCFGCGKNYGILDHFMQHYGMTYLESIEELFKRTKINYSFSAKGSQHKKYKYPKYDKVENKSNVIEYLGSRGISIETITKCDVQQDAKSNIVFNFYDENDVLTLVKYRPSHKISKGDTKTWCQQDADARPILFNMNRIDPTQPLVITEGEIDCLSVIESGYGNAVSIPLGAQNSHWIEECYDWLEQFEKIILWFDNDDAGTIARKEASNRLGTWRCLYVDLPQEKVGKDTDVKDANAILYKYGKEKVLDYILHAQEIPITGIKNMADVEDFDIEKAPGLFTHLEDLDNLVYKFLYGSVVLVTGSKGSGKSSLINQIFVCEPLNQGSDCFIFSGEMGESVVKSWIELTMAGYENIQLKDKFIHIINGEARKKMRKWYDGRVWIYDEPSNKKEDIIERAINSTRRYGTKVWLLDNLMTIDIGANENTLLQKQKEFIVELVKYAKLYGVLIVLIAHPRKLAVGTQLSSDDIAGSGDLGNLAHYIVSVHRYSDKEKQGEKDGKGNYKKGKEPIEFDVSVSILKNRYTGKIGECQLYFDYTSYRFYKNLKELHKRYNWNDFETFSQPLCKIDPREKDKPDLMRVGD